MAANFTSCDTRCSSCNVALFRLNSDGNQKSVTGLVNCRKVAGLGLDLAALSLKRASPTKTSPQAPGGGSCWSPREGSVDLCLRDPDMEGVSPSQGCCNQVPPTRGLKTTEICLTVLEAGSLRSQCQPGHPASGIYRETVCLLLTSCW